MSSSSSSSYIDITLSATEHCEAMSTLHPDLSSTYTEISTHISRKLYHQLSVSILTFVSSPTRTTLRTTPDGINSYLALYDKVVSTVEKKLNPLTLARIAACVAGSLAEVSGDGVAARAVLENLLEKNRAGGGGSGGGRGGVGGGSGGLLLGKMASLFVESKLALLGLRLVEKEEGDGMEEDDDKKKDANKMDKKKHFEHTKELLQKNEKILSELSLGDDGVESDLAVIHSSHYECAMTYRKAVGPPEAYYREAIRYLNYTPLSSLSDEECLKLAVDVSLAALTGDGVFNFGEILQNPILDRLRADQHSEYLVKLMEAGSTGDVEGFNDLTRVHAESISQQPVLVSRASVVREKITLLALLNMIFDRPSSERTLNFHDIATTVGMPSDQVELAIMRALSLGLMKGTMDQVDGTVEVTWIMPRVLDNDQLNDLSVRFGEWAVKVSKTRDYMAEHTHTIVS